MHASTQVSIAIPRLHGGGAEKTTMQIAKLLAGENRISRVYAGETEGAESFPEFDIVDLGSLRARGAITSLMGKLKDDPAGILFMTLGYINLAPFARLSSPSRRIVLRLGNTIGPELALLSPSAQLRYRLSVQAACLAASKIIVQCNYMKEDLHKHVNVDDRKIQVIYNFVEDEIWQHSVSEKSPIASSYLFTAATMKPQKAFDTLLAAYAMARQTRVTDRKLVIAGVAQDDPEILALMRANQLSTEEVVCLGFVNNIYDLIAHSELCVLSSRYEGFCNFLLEAAGLGKKILATDSPGGNAELFENYRNVVSVPVDDVSRLCEGMGESRNDLAVSEAQSSLTPFLRETVFNQYREALLWTRAGTASVPSQAGMTTSKRARTDCPCCETNGLVPLRGYESSYLRRCKQCQFVYAGKVPTALELEEHYAHKYDKKYAPDAWVSETTRHRLKKLIASFSPYRENNRLLDVGCGRGLLLEAAQDAGWASFGTEYSTDAISLGVDRGFTMHEGELTDDAFPREHFDVIVMTESIEHMPEPRDAMLTISRFLRVGGLLYLTTPNFGSLSRRVLRSKWNVIEYPAHLSYFRAEALTHLLESSGLSLVKLETTGFSPTRFKKSLLGQEHPTMAITDADERVRSALEASWQARLLKSAINQGLSMTRLGDTLRAEFVKTKSV